jgi:hypothetical protein
MPAKEADEEAGEGRGFGFGVVPREGHTDGARGVRDGVMCSIFTVRIFHSLPSSDFNRRFLSDHFASFSLHFKRSLSGF